MTPPSPLEIRGKRCVVMGLGAFGGGVGATQWLARQGAKEIIVTDLADEGKLKDSIAEIAPLIRAGTVRLRLGMHDAGDFQNADLVIANPAVPKPWKNPFLAAARQAGAMVTTELRLALQSVPAARVIAVTGSSGKSTTSALIRVALDGFQGRRAHLAGNIGGSLLQNCPAIAPDEWLVLELSSFMLWWLGAESGSPPWHARIGVLTNLSDNHLDWHGDAAHYSASKSVIRNPVPDTQIFLSRFDIESPAAAAEWTTLPAGHWWKNPQLDPHTEKCMPLFESARLIGEHNRRNALLALHAAVAALRIDDPRLDAPAAAKTLARKMNLFTGLPHRLSLVHESGGVRWIDDSKATTPASTLFAVRSFPDQHRIHLIVGGLSKGADLPPVAALAPALAGLYSIGTSAKDLTRAGGTNCETLENAVKTIRSRIRPGDVVLLSPGCASWDQFKNYEERGERFAELSIDR